MQYKIRTSKSVYIIAAILAPLLRPNGINSLSHGGQYVYDVFSIISVCILFSIYLSKKDKKIDSQFLIIGLMFFSILLSTIRYGESILVHLRIATTCLGAMLSVIVFREKPREFIYALLLDLEILIYLNALCIVLFPNGMYLAHGTFGSSSNWLMGYDNHWFIFYYGAYFVAILYYLYGGSKLRSLMLIAVLHLTTLYVLSGVLVAGLLFIDAVYLLKIYRRRWFSLKGILAISGLLSIVFIFFMMNPTVQYFISDVLSKGESMLARGRIWNKTLEMISFRPLMGNGRWHEEHLVALYGLAAAVNAHNMWLEIIFEGGVITGFLFIWGILLVATRKNNKNTLIYKSLLVHLASALIAASVDAFIETRGVLFFVLLSIGYNIRYFAEPILQKRIDKLDKSMVRFRWL